MSKQRSRTFAAAVLACVSSAGITAPAAAADVEVYTIEATQAVQTFPGNGVPLISRKPTLVRVYLRALDGPSDKWDDLIGTLVVRNAATGAQVGPTLHANRLVPAGENLGRRDVLAETINFALRPEQTVAGAKTLEVSVRSFNGYADANPANNTATVGVDFTLGRSIQVIGFTYANAGRSSRCINDAPDGHRPSAADIEQHRRFVENMFPVSQVAIVPLPMDPVRSFDDAGCNAYAEAHGWLTRMVDRLNPGGSATGYLITPESSGYHGWCCSGSWGNRTALGQDYAPDRGAIMAHELGHRFGRGHTFDGWAAFPHADETIGGEVGMRLTPTLEVMAGRSPDGRPQTYDIMAYRHPQWISPHTYCGLMDWLYPAAGPSCATTIRTAGLPTDAPLTGTPVQFNAAQLFGDQLYVAGRLEPDGTASFGPFEMMRGAFDNLSDTRDSAYQLRLEAQDGKVLVAIPVVIESHDGAADESVPFSLAAPWDPATVRIVFARDGKDLAERYVTPNAPVFAGLWGPAPGEVVSGWGSLSWDAYDPDGDAVTYSVDYSADGGQSWLPLDVLVQGNYLDINFDELPGSDVSWLRVVASDGVNTTEAYLDSVFQVPMKAPRLTLTASAEKAAGELGEWATVSAFDWEDGAIVEDAAFAWESDIDGYLGDGGWMPLAALSPGYHLLTVSVTDRHGNVAATSTAVSVVE